MLKFFSKKKSDLAGNLVSESTNSEFVDPHMVCHPKPTGKNQRLDNIEMVCAGDPDGFAVAVGDWEDQNSGIPLAKVLLMRWNGNGEENTTKNRGYPIVGTEFPGWFPIPSIFAEPIIRRLRQYHDESKSVTEILDGYGFDDRVKIHCAETNDTERS